MTMKTNMAGGKVTSIEIIYAVGASNDGKTLVAATVKKEVFQPIEITTRRGDKICVSDDALEGLIIALQQVREQIRTFPELKAK